MFELLLLFLFILLPVIGKSLEEKKRIEKTRQERPVILPTPSEPLKSKRVESSNDELTTITFEDAQVLSDEDGEDKKNRYYESIFEDIETDYGESLDIQLEVLGKDKQKYKYDSKYREKDILRGIIFSEILSEPKSIKNRKGY